MHERPLALNDLSFRFQRLLLIDHAPAKKMILINLKTDDELVNIPDGLRSV